jgi:hypothetical protein
VYIAAISQRTQRESQKILLDSLDSFQMHAIVRDPHDACVIQMRSNERVIQRFQSIRILELFTNSSYVTQHPGSFYNQRVNV